MEPTGTPLGPSPLLFTTSPDHAVASWASNELGVWNQDRVKPRFRLSVSAAEGLKSTRSNKFSSLP